MTNDEAYANRLRTLAALARSQGKGTLMESVLEIARAEGALARSYKRSINTNPWGAPPENYQVDTLLAAAWAFGYATESRYLAQKDQGSDGGE